MSVILAKFLPLRKNPDDDSSELVESDAEKAEILQEYFCSVFTTEPDGPIPQMDNIVVRNEMGMDITITEMEIKKEIRNLNANKSCGPDNIHPRTLKELGDLIIYPLKEIFNRSLSDMELPGDWKMASVTPIY